MCINIYLNIYVYVYKYLFFNIYAYVCIYIYMHTYICYIHIHLYIYVVLFICIHSRCLFIVVIAERNVATETLVIIRKYLLIVFYSHCTVLNSHVRNRSF